MKKLIYIVSFTLGIPCLSQNLVPNPSFETMNDCNITFNDNTIEGFIADWFTYSWVKSSVDVLHTCLPFPELQPPNTIRGYSYPHTGNGVLGIAYSKEINYREVCSVKLIDELIKDSAYCVSFWVKNTKVHEMYYWVEQIGLLFTSDSISEPLINGSNPDVRSYTDLGKNEWIEISGYYLAKGGEKYANIGFIGPDIEKYQSIPYLTTNYVPYYFLDDVSVTPCNKDSLLAVICEFPNVFSPDGSSVNDQYTLQLRNIKKLDIQVFNRWGNVVKSYDGVTQVWDGTDEQGQALAEGVYFIKALAETNFGELIPKYQYVHLVR
jgi:gliding motility-associated-like protein